LGRPFVGRRSHTGARARGERVAGEIGDRCAGEEEGKGEEDGADVRGHLARERKETEARSGPGKETAPTRGPGVTAREGEGGNRAGES
jgi:hypothetical protein